MRKLMKRLLVLTLALLLVGSVALPATLAESAALPTTLARETKLVASNASSLSLYAGMKDKLVVYDRYGNALNSSNYKWKSSKSSVVSVNSSGVITGKKVGSATITATNKNNKRDKCSIKINVKRNKVDKIYNKPSATAVSYKNAGILLKSVEIASPSKVVVEYYVFFNFPSNWKASKIISVSDAINLYNRSTGIREKVIVGDDYQVTSTKISGFKAKKGRFVQTIKVTYSGSRVHCANIKLSDYLVYNSSNCRFQYKYYK